MAGIENSVNGAKKVSRKECIAIIVDVLRACTTISTLLFNGAKEVIPVDSDLKSFMQLRKMNPNAVFVGEKNRLKIPEANLTNSPSMCMKNKALYKGKRVFFSSTDFSRVLEYFRKNENQPVFLGCVVNAKFVSQASFDLANKSGKNIYFVKCSDPEDRKGRVDAIGCAIIAKHLERLGCRLTVELHRTISRMQNESILDLISKSKPAKILNNLGCFEDVWISCELNKFSVVPSLFNGSIIDYPS